LSTQYSVDFSAPSSVQAIVVTLALFIGQLKTGIQEIRHWCLHIRRRHGLESKKESRR